MLQVAGGSGWVYTEISYNTWKSGNPTDANQYELTEEYYLTEASTIAGNASFPAPNGGTETGHTGNGYARITCLDSVTSEEDSFEPGEISGKITSMSCSGMELSAKVTLKGDIDYTKSKFVFTQSGSELGTSDEGKYKDGNISPESNIIKKQKPAGTYYLHILLVSNTGTKKEIISTTTATSTEIFDYSYTGSVQTVTLPAGEYKLEVWGAQGGDNSSQTTVYTGGKGGYSVGYITLTSDKIIYIYVGGKGKCSNGWSQSTNTSYGGYNGGGYAGKTGSNDSALQISGGGGRCY